MSCQRDVGVDALVSGDSELDKLPIWKLHAENRNEEAKYASSRETGFGRLAMAALSRPSEPFHAN
jgi:hypothetical protein